MLYIEDKIKNIVALNQKQLSFNLKPTGFNFQIDEFM